MAASIFFAHDGGGGMRCAGRISFSVRFFLFPVCRFNPNAYLCTYNWNKSLLTIPLHKVEFLSQPRKHNRETEKRLSKLRGTRRNAKDTNDDPA